MYLLNGAIIQYTTLMPSSLGGRVWIECLCLVHSQRRGGYGLEDWKRQEF